MHSYSRRTVITSYSIHYTKLYEWDSAADTGASKGTQEDKAAGKGKIAEGVAGDDAMPGMNHDGDIPVEDKKTGERCPDFILFPTMEGGVDDRRRSTRTNRGIDDSGKKARNIAPDSRRVDGRGSTAQVP